MRDYFYDFCQNSVMFTAVIGWFAAQILKVILVFITNRRLDFSRFVGSGGMPSSHSAFVVSLATAVGLTDGFSSTTFAICVVLAFVVMYDAAGVRRSAGQQAVILNKLVDSWSHGDFTHTDKRLKELLGHTPIEVAAGAILGIIIAIIRHCY